MKYSYQELENRKKARQQLIENIVSKAIFISIGLWFLNVLFNHEAIRASFINLLFAAFFVIIGNIICISTLYIIFKIMQKVWRLLHQN